MSNDINFFETPCTYTLCLFLFIWFKVSNSIFTTSMINNMDLLEVYRFNILLKKILIHTRSMSQNSNVWSQCHKALNR